MKEIRGGKRKGSGRPQSIETKILTIRVAATCHDKLKEIIKHMDDKYRQNDLKQKKP